MASDFGGISTKEFFGTYWRKFPFCVRGGALNLLKFKLTVTEFMRLCARLKKNHAQLVSRSNKELIFAQNLDLISPKLSAVSERYQALATFSNVWFDGTLAADKRGLGSHYDIADSLILQQSGRKLWKLHPPTLIPELEIQRRMLKQSPLDMMFMPSDEPQEFILEAGDILYIPILWVHWGISLGQSLSLSLGFTATNSLDYLWTLLGASLAEGEIWRSPAKPEDLESIGDTLTAIFRRDEVKQKFMEAWRRVVLRRAPKVTAWRGDSAFSQIFSALKRVLSEEQAWWEPLPVFPNTRSGAVNIAATDLRAYSDRLLAPFYSIDFGDRLREAVLAECQKTTTAERATGANLCPQLNAAHKVEGTPAYGDSSQASFSFEDLFALKGTREISHVSKMAALSYRDRLYKIGELSRDWLGTTPCTDSLQECLRVLSRLPQESLICVMRRPEILSWLGLAEEALEFQYYPYLERILEHFAALMLPVLLAQNASFEGEKFTLPSDRDTSLSFLPFGKRVLWRTPKACAIQVQGFGSELVFLTGDSSVFRLSSRELLQEGKTVITDGACLDTLPGFIPRGTIVPPAPGWWVDFFPRGRRAGGIVLESRTSVERLLQLESSFRQGLTLLKEIWPEAASNVENSIMIVLPRADGEPFEMSESVEPFRGVIAATPRSPEEAARTLTREAGRRLALEVLDLFRLSSHSKNWSCCYPTEQQNRLLPELIPKALALLFDIEVCNRLDLPSLSSQLCFTEIHKEIQHHGRLTESGKQVAAALRRRFKESTRNHRR